MQPLNPFPNIIQYPKDDNDRKNKSNLPCHSRDRYERWNNTSDRTEKMLWKWKADKDIILIASGKAKEAPQNR